MRIAIACDHGGITLKDTVKKALRETKCEITDLGTDSTESVDYPDYAAKAIQAYKDGSCDRIILLCGTGIGMSIAANRIFGIRAALCHDAFTARMAREHNDSNCLVIGARTTGPGVAEEIVKIWLETPFAGGHHHGRLEKIEFRAAEINKILGS
jgi:ribose 5-phosphate isomerase B